MTKFAHINNLKISIVQSSGLLELIKEYFHGQVCRSIFFINAHCSNIAQRNKEYSRVLNNADIVLNDGSGIQIASWINGIDLLENMNGTDFIPKTIELARDEGVSVFFLGATEENINQAVKNIEKRFEGIKIGGYNNGYFSSDEDDYIVDKINSSKASLLIVGMGVPKQEMWISKHQQKFTNLKIAIAGGAILDFLSGKIKRAPNWMRVIGIEWIFRWMQEPKRLTKRYLFGNPVFISSIIKHKLRRKK